MGGVFATYAAVDLLSNVNYYNYQQYLSHPDHYPIMSSDKDVKLRYQRGYIPFTRKCHAWNHHIRVHEVVTFGMPRIGNRYLADHIAKLIRKDWVDCSPQAAYYRVTHYRDLIPRLPPSFTDYHHTGNEVGTPVFF